MSTSNLKFARQCSITIWRPTTWRSRSTASLTFIVFEEQLLARFWASHRSRGLYVTCSSNTKCIRWLCLPVFYTFSPFLSLFHFFFYALILWFPFFLTFSLSLSLSRHIRIAAWNCISRYIIYNRWTEPQQFSRSTLFTIGHCCACDCSAVLFSDVVNGNERWVFCWHVSTRGVLLALLSWLEASDLYYHYYHHYHYYYYYYYHYYYRYYDYTVSFFVFFQFVSPLCFLIFPFFFLLRIRGHLLYVWISIWIYIYVYIFPHIKYINIYYIYIFLFHVCMVLSFSDEYDSYMYIYILLYLLIIRLFVRLFFLVSTAPFFYPFFLMLCTLSISAYRSAPRCVVIDIRQLANG